MAEKEHVGPIALQIQAGMYDPVASSRFMYMNARVERYLLVVYFFSNVARHHSSSANANSENQQQNHTIGEVFSL